MAWRQIQNNPYWEYDDDPPDPGVGNALRPLWLKQSNGIRNFRGHEIYVKCRRVGTSVEDAGELSKTFWDSKVIKDIITGSVSGFGELALPDPSTVSGIAERYITGPGTLVAQQSTTAGSGTVTV